MRSIFLLPSVLGAVSHASECQADENSLLQARKTVRKSNTMQSKDVFQNLRDAANSLVEGSDATMSREEVTDALNAANDILSELAPALRQQVENTQQQIAHAAAAVQACHAEEQAELRTSLQESLGTRAAAVESCQSTLEELQAAEAHQCGIAEDCLCDEARVRTTDQEALCTAVTETYEVSFCDYQHVCTVFRRCHSSEVEVYNQLRTDVEAEMALVVQEYIAVEQAECLTDLMTQALTPPMTPISHAALIACDDVDVSALTINFPDLPSEPAACPAPAHGGPPCGARHVQFDCVQGAQNNHNQLGSFRGYTTERCEQECTANEACLSFDTSTNGGNECYLSSTTAATGGGLRAHDTRYQYCERRAAWVASTFHCVQGAQNGHNQLGSFRGYTTERCEQECAANEACLSFDTSTNGGDECYLSSTTAATGGGLRAHDTRYQYCEKA